MSGCIHMLPLLRKWPAPVLGPAFVSPVQLIIMAFDQHEHEVRIQKAGRYLVHLKRDQYMALAKRTITEIRVLEVAGKYIKWQLRDEVAESNPYGRVDGNTDYLPKWNDSTDAFEAVLHFIAENDE